MVDETPQEAPQTEQAAPEPAGDPAPVAPAPAADPPQPEPAAAPESAPSAPVEAEAPSQPVQDTSAQPEAAPAPAEPQPAAEAAPAEAPAPDVDPLTVLAADLQRVSGERDTLQSNHDRMYAEVNSLQRDLDAARAELAEERATRGPLGYIQQITDLKQQLVGADNEIVRLKGELDQAKAQVPAVAQAVHVATLEAVQSAPVDLSDAAHARIKSDFLDALAEHAVAKVAPKPEPEQPPGNPFINRQG